MAKPRLRQSGIGHLPQPGRITREKDGTISEQTVGRLHNHLRIVTQAINGGLRFSASEPLGSVGNFKMQMVEMTSPSTPDQEFSTPHSLESAPMGYIVVLQNKAGSLYVSNFGGWSSDLVYFKCDVASVLFNIYLMV